MPSCALREYEQFYNRHRPHQGIANIRPLKPLPEPITDPDRLARLNSTEQFTDAVKLADRLLNLRHQRTLRMLAVVSDGWLPNIPAGQKLITTLHHTGCAVLWLQPAERECHTYTDTTTITVADPADPADAIDHVATTAITALGNA